jgi:hypothetical protein
MAELVATLEHGEISFSDTSVSPQNAYSYTIVSVNDLGESSVGTRSNVVVSLITPETQFLETTINVSDSNITELLLENSLSDIVGFTDSLNIEIYDYALFASVLDINSINDSITPSLPEVYSKWIPGDYTIALWDAQDLTSGNWTDYVNSIVLTKIGTPTYQVAGGGAYSTWKGVTIESGNYFEKSSGSSALNLVAGSNIVIQMVLKTPAVVPTLSTLLANNATAYFSYCMFTYGDLKTSYDWMKDNSGNTEELGITRSIDVPANTMMKLRILLPTNGTGYQFENGVQVGSSPITMITDAITNYMFAIGGGYGFPGTVYAVKIDASTNAAVLNVNDGGLGEITTPTTLLCSLYDNIAVTDSIVNWESLSGASFALLMDEASGSIVDEIGGITLGQYNADNTYSVTGLLGYDPGITMNPTAGGFAHSGAHTSMDFGTGDGNVLVVCRSDATVVNWPEVFVTMILEGNWPGWGFRVYHNSTHASSSVRFSLKANDAGNTTVTGTWNSANVLSAINDGTINAWEVRIDRTLGIMDLYLNDVKEGSSVDISALAGLNITTSSNSGIGVGCDYRSGINRNIPITIFFARVKKSVL